MQYLFKRESALMDVTPLENLFIVEYMPKAPEGYVKAYLYGLMQCYSPALAGEDMAGALGMEELELSRAFLYWQERGLVDIISSEPFAVSFRDIRHSLEEHVPAFTRKYAELVGKLSELLHPRQLTGAELKRVYDWIDVFGMDEDAVVLLVKYCVERQGENRVKKVSVNYMDSVARTWVNDGILSAPAAQEWMSRRNELTVRAANIYRYLGKYGNIPQTQVKLYEKWTREWGFDDDAILLACEEEKVHSAPNIKSVDTVLESWHARGYSAELMDDYIRGKDRLSELCRAAFERSGIKRPVKAYEFDQLRQWYEAWHMDAELILLAADYAFSESQPFAAMKKLVKRWHDRGISGVSAAREDYEAMKREPSAEKAKTHRSMQYLQHTYSADELDSIGVILLDDEDGK